MKCSLWEHQEQIYFATFEKADMSIEQYCSFAKLRLIAKGLYTYQSSHRNSKGDSKYPGPDQEADITILQNILPLKYRKALKGY